MKTTLAAACILAALAAPRAQVAAPNAAGVAMSHLHFNVADAEANRRFWIALGGVEAPPRDGARVVVFPGLAIHLSPGAPSGTPEGSVIAHAAFRVKTFAQVEAAGIPVERRRIEGRESGVVVAPSGDRVELFEEHAEQVRFRADAGATTESAERHNRPLTAAIEPHHLHFNVPQGAESSAQRWYVEQFGGVPGIRLRYPAADFPGMNFNFSGVATPGAPSNGRPLDHIAFEVRDVAALVHALSAAGMRIEVLEATPRRAMVIDPWGTSIELIQQEPPAQDRR